MKPPTSRNLTPQQLGKAGEVIAGKYLQEKGYQIIARNFRIRYGELDIIATCGDSLVFIEVKTRINTQFGLPEEAVTPRKLREIIKTAECFRQSHPDLPEELRIEVIGMILDADFKIKYFNHITDIS